MKHTLFALCLTLGLLACGSSSSSPSQTTQTASTGSEAALVPNGMAHVGDRTTCLVSHEEIVVTETTPHAEHDGRTYYFCCPHCLEQFTADPHQFLPADHDAAGTGTSPTTTPTTSS